MLNILPFLILFLFRISISGFLVPLAWAIILCNGLAPLVPQELI